MPPVPFTMRLSRPDLRLSRPDVRSLRGPASRTSSTFSSMDRLDKKTSLEDVNKWMVDSRRSSRISATSMKGRQSPAPTEESACTDCYPEVLALTKVGANFEIDWEAMMMAGPPRSIITRCSSYTGLATDRKTARARTAPSMLLPQDLAMVHGRSQSVVNEMFSSFRSSSVVALDNMTPFILAPDSYNNRSSTPPRPASVPPTPDRSLASEDRIESFSHIYTQSHERLAPRPRSAKEDMWSRLEASISCPQCRHILRHSPHKRRLLEWYKGQLDMIKVRLFQNFIFSVNFWSPS